jgi:hypothetical protein
MLHGKNYSYQPREPVVQQHYQTQRVQQSPRSPGKRSAQDSQPGKKKGQGEGH